GWRCPPLRVSPIGLRLSMSRPEVRGSRGCGMGSSDQDARRPAPPHDEGPSPTRPRLDRTRGDGSGTSRGLKPSYWTTNLLLELSVPGTPGGGWDPLLE